MSRLPQLPEHVISSINSYNRTKYPNNRVSTRFNYTNPALHYDVTGRFDGRITITWNANIGEYWRREVVGWINNLYDQTNTVGRDTKRIEINNKLKELPDYQTIFGDDLEIYGLQDINTRYSTDMNSIQLQLTFAYTREEDEEAEGEFIDVNFNSERGTRMREAATFLTAHTMVETMKYLIPAPDTPLQDYLTIDEDGDIINQKGEEFGEYGYNRTNNTYIDRRNDYKLVKDYEFIFSLGWWNNILANETTSIGFTLVNNKRLPLSSGMGGATMTQLKF